MINKLLYLLKISFLHLKQKKTRTLLTILSITLCMTLVSSVVNDLYSDLFSQYNYAVQSNGTWLFQCTSSSQETIEKLKKVVDFDQTLYRYHLGSTYLFDNYQVDLYSQDNFDMCPYYLYDGNYPTNKDEILVSRKFIALTKHQIGDVIQMSFVDEATQRSYQRQMQITGVIQFRGVRQEVGYRDFIVTCSNETSSIYNLYVSPYNITEQQVDIIEKLIQSDRHGSTFNNSQGIINQHMNQPVISYFDISFVQLILLICLLVIMYLTMTNIFIINSKERQHTYGLLESIGATFKDLFIVNIFEMFFYAFLSFPISMLLGYYGTKAIYAYSEYCFLKNYETGFPSVYQTSLVINILIVVIGLIILFFAVMSALWRMRKQKVIHLIKEDYRNYQSKTKKSILLKSKRLYSTLSHQYQWTSLTKYVSILLTLIFTIIFFNISIYISSLSNQWVKESYPNPFLKVYLTLDLSKERNDIEDIISYISQYNDENYMEMTVDLGALQSVSLDSLTDEYLQNSMTPSKEMINVSFYGVDPQLFEEVTNQKEPVIINEITKEVDTRKTKDISIFKEDIPIELSLSNNYVIDDEWYYDHLDMTIVPKGQYTFEDFGLSEQSVYREMFLDINVIAPYTYLLNLYDQIEQPGDSYIQLRMMLMNDHPDKLLEKLENDHDLKDYFIEYSIPSESSYTGSDQMIQFFMSVMIFIVCILNLGIVVLSNIFDRKNDYGILRSIGMNDTDLKKMIYQENISLITLALVIAVPVSILCERYLFYYQYPNLQQFIPTYQLLLFITLGAYFVISLASYYAYRSITHQIIVSQIKG